VVWPITSHIQVLGTTYLVGLVPVAAGPSAEGARKLHRTWFWWHSSHVGGLDQLHSFPSRWHLWQRPGTLALVEGRGVFRSSSGGGVGPLRGGGGTFMTKGSEVPGMDLKFCRVCTWTTYRLPVVVFSCPYDTMDSVGLVHLQGRSDLRPVPVEAPDRKPPGIRRMHSTGSLERGASFHPCMHLW